MAINDEYYLHVRKGDSTYLLLRSPSHFHLVRIDANLSESRMQKLLRMYPCQTAHLRKLGVHYSAFKAENLRGIVVKGYKAGDKLELWLGGDSRDYQLERDYSDEALAQFFSGFQIWKRLPPKWEGLDRSLIRTITWIVNGVSIACAFLFYFVYSPYWFWSIACIICQLTAIILPTIYPESFALIDADDRSKFLIPKGKGNLLAALVSTGFALTLRSMTDFTFENAALGWSLLISAGLYLCLFAPILWISRNTHHRVIVSISIVIMMIFLGMGTVEQLNYLFDYRGGDSQILEVTDKRVSRGTRSTTYYCDVILPNGNTMELTTSARIYRDIVIGEDLQVTHFSGAFHIPFSVVELAPEE